MRLAAALRDLLWGYAQDAFAAGPDMDLGGYIAIRVAASYAFLAYSDNLNGYNEFMYRRNLSFNTNIWEGAIQGDFNFFKYIPGSNFPSLFWKSTSVSIVRVC